MAGESANPSGVGEQSYVKQDSFDKFQSSFYAIMGGLVLVLGLGFVNLLITVQGMVMDSNRAEMSEMKSISEKVSALEIKVWSSDQALPSLKK